MTCQERGGQHGARDSRQPLALRVLHVNAYGPACHSRVQDGADIVTVRNRDKQAKGLNRGRCKTGKKGRKQGEGPKQAKKQKQT